MIFGSCTLTIEEHQLLLNKFNGKDRVFNVNHFICKLSKMKDDGFTSSRSDFEELFRLIEAGNG